MDTLERRVEKLERENRRLKRVGVLALAVVIGVVVMGQAPTPKVSDEIRTRRLVVEDGAGRKRVTLDDCSFTMYDRDEKTRWFLCAFADVTALFLNDPAGNNRAGVTAWRHKSSLFACDAANKARVEMLVYGDEPSLTVKDPEGRASVLAVSGLIPSVNLAR